MTDEPTEIEPADPALARVRAAAERVAQLPGQPLTEHAGTYQEIHGELQAALAEIDGG